MHQRRNEDGLARSRRPLHEGKWTCGEHSRQGLGLLVVKFVFLLQLFDWMGIGQRLRACSGTRIQNPDEVAGTRGTSDDPPNRSLAAIETSLLHAAPKAKLVALVHQRRTVSLLGPHGFHVERVGLGSLEVELADRPPITAAVLALDHDAVATIIVK